MKPDMSKVANEPKTVDESRPLEEPTTSGDPSWGGQMPCVIINFMRQPLSAVTVTHRYLDYTDSFYQDDMDPLGQGRSFGKFTINVGSDDLSYWDVSAQTVPDGQLVNVNNKDQLILPEDFQSGLPIYAMIYSVDYVRLQSPRSNPWAG